MNSVVVGAFLGRARVLYFCPDSSASFFGNWDQVPTLLNGAGFPQFQFRCTGRGVSLIAIDMLRKNSDWFVATRRLVASMYPPDY